MSGRKVTFGDSCSFPIPGRDEYYTTTRRVGPSESIRHVVSRVGSILRTEELGKVHPDDFDRTRKDVLESHLKALTDHLVEHEDIGYLVTNVAGLGTTRGNTLSEKLAVDFIATLIDGFRAKKCVRLASDGYIPHREGNIGGFHLIVNGAIDVVKKYVENCVYIDFRNTEGVPVIHYVVGNF